MNMKRMTKWFVAVAAAVLGAAAARAGDSAPFALNTRTGARIARETEPIAYSTAWSGGAKVQVYVDGVLLKEAAAPATGTVVWNAAEAGPGVHTLTHVSGGTTLTAQFTVETDWLIFRLHGNGVATADGRTVVDVVGKTGTGVEFPVDLFTRSANLPGDVSGRLLGWYPGTEVFDGTQTSVKDLFQGAWLEENDIEEWKRRGWAEETENGAVVVHFQAVWQSEVQVRVCNSSGGTLTPAELVGAVKFGVHHDIGWRTGEWTVQVPPGEQRLLVEFESGYEAHYTATLWKNRVEMEPTAENAWIWNLPSAGGPQTVYLEVRVGAKEETGWLEFDLSGKLTAAQATAWGGKVPAFDEKKVQIRVWPAGVWDGAGLPANPQGTLALQAGTYRAEFQYARELAGNHPYWGRDETLVKDGIVVSPGKNTKVRVEFLPFGTEETDFYWISFNGNGGNLSGDGLRWYGRWHDTGGATLNVRALPEPTRAGGWRFMGWYTPGGKKIPGWRELEDYLRHESLANQTLTADWKAVADAATGSGAPVPNAWLTAHAQEALAENGGDFEEASLATAANGMAVWECYLTGLEPADANASFKAELVQEEEKLKPRPKGGEKDGRTYRVWGKQEVDDEDWVDVTEVEDLEAEGWRFFRLGVALTEEEPAANAATLALGAAGRTFSADAASSKELGVTANVAWTAKSSASWLTVRTGSGSGNGKIVYDVAANTGSASRTGTITVSGGGLTRTFTVTQNGV